MSTYFYAIVLTLMMIIYVYCIISVMKSDNKYKDDIRRLFGSAIMPMFANGCVVMTRHVMVARFGYTLFYVSTDVLLFFLLRFVLLYCDMPYRRIWYSRVFMAVAAIDSILIVLNPFLYHVFKVTPVDVGNNVIFYYADKGWYYHVHVAICFAAAAAAIGILIKKALEGSKIYYSKYFTIAVSILFTVIWDVGVILRNEVIDTMLFGIGMTGLLIYYFSVIYKPMGLIHRMIMASTTFSHFGFVVYDRDGKCIFFNEKFHTMFKVDYGDMEKADEAVRSVVDKDDLHMEGLPYVKRITGEDGETEKIYETVMSRIYDTSHVYAGFFLSIEDKTDEELALEKELYEASHDSLTGIYNADALYRFTLNKLNENKDKHYFVVVAKIQDFSVITDIFGHAKSNELLVRMTDYINKRIIHGGAMGRLGVDRLGMLVEDKYFDPESIKRDIKPISHMDNEYRYPVILRIGAYEITDTSIDVRSMYNRAFFAIENDPGDDLGHISFFDDKIKDEVIWENKITGSLEEALIRGDIIPYIQAQVGTDGEVKGGEFLIRWNHRTEGFLAPYKFVSILEKRGLIVKADKYIWEQACRTIKRWNEDGFKDNYISVNISPVDFYFCDVYETITGLVNKYGIRPEQLHLEITETAIIDDSGARIEMMRRLRNEGYIIEMDDFGSGYSSLNMLRSLPIDVIKLDMVFLRDMDSADSMQKTMIILSNLINMAKELNLFVISEGVESPDQKDFLTDNGCDQFQGYLFSKPIPVSEFENRFMRAR